MQKTAFGFDPVLAITESRPERYRSLTKTLLVVKLTILLTVVAFFQVHASGTMAQTVTISGKDLTLKQVFSAIEKQTDYVLLNTKGTFDGTKPVSLTVHKMPLRQFLDFILKDEQLEYEIQGKTILLSRKANTVAAPAKPTAGMLELFPEKEPIKGMVLNEQNLPFSGVSVVVKRTKKGSITDAAGKFSVQADTGDILIISYVGYADLEVKITGASVMAKMKVSHSVLDQTQVTAYGKTSRRLATGNIGTVTAEEIERQPVMTVLEALIGKVPGLTIQQTSGNSAAPMRVNIRGVNTINPNAITDPLYVIDGIPFTTLNASTITGNVNLSMGAVQGGRPNTLGENPLLSINPRDIESVSVLKDADATSIYGSRGANGVILITTKKPKPGPTSFNVSINQGITMNTSYPKLLNTQEYLAMRREAFRNDGIIPDQSNAPDLMRWDTTKYTDWQRLFVGTGSLTTVNAGISGGMLQTSYSIAASYTTRKELMNNGGRNNAGTLRAGFSHTSNDQKFGFNFSNNLSLTEVTAANIGELGALPPNAPDIYNEKGELNFEPYRTQNRSDYPFASLKNYSESNTFSLQSNMHFRYEIVRGLTFSTNAGYQFSHNTNGNYSPEAANDPIIVPYASAIYGESSNKSWTIEPQLKYNALFGKGNFSAQLIGNMQSVRTRGETIDARQFPNDALIKSYNNALSKTFMEGVRQRKTVSGAVILRYAWDNKYVININARRDGSSQFGPGKQFGNFASVGLAWIASDEKWMRKIMPDWFSFFKFRGSYGITGGDNVSDYEYLSRWSKAPTLTSTRTLFRYNGLDAFHVLKPMNQQFQWESTTQSEMGISLAFLQNRISLDLSYYRKVSDNQLTDLPMPVITGFNSVVANSEAKVENSGLDLQLSARLLNTKDWGLSFSFNMGRNRNKLLAFPNLERSSYREMLKVGESLSTQYYLKFTGIDPLTGNATYEDRNKDGVITTGNGFFPISDIDDRYISMDLNVPKFSGGFSFGANYKELTVAAGFSLAIQRRAHPYLMSVPGGRVNIAIPDDVRNNHWQKPGDLAKYPRYSTIASNVIRASDANFVNGTYLRMNNLALSYSFPAKWISKIRMKNASFSIQMQNLFTISSFKGVNPDLPSGVFVTPIPRTIATQLNFNF
jgi:TonB-linked SusC/RagA family outer membrane protein